MRPNKGRGAKMVTEPLEKRQRAPPVDPLESASLSFLQGLQKNDDNPLHSTAIDEDLILPEDGRMDRDSGKGNPEKGRTTNMKQRGAAVKRKEKEMNEDEKRAKKSTTNKRVQARTEKGGEMKSKKGRGGKENGHSSAPKTKGHPSASESVAAASGLKRQVGKKQTNRTSEGQKAAARPKEKKKKKESDSISQEEFDSEPGQQHLKPLLSSEEEEGDADTSWKPSPKKARVQEWVRTRKSPSNMGETRKSASEDDTSSPESTNEEEGNKDERRKRKRKPGRAGGTESELVLEAFLNFCERHRASLESTAVKRAFDSFSSSVKEQLLQKITSSKEFRTIRRENAKVKSLIGRKTQTLLQAKNELFSAESQVASLEKEEVQLNERLTDLRRGQAFIQSLTQFTSQYLEHTRTHPQEKDKFGASSLPALLLQTQQIVETSNNQLGTI